jgi:pilus assembly protein CpaE
MAINFAIALFQITKKRTLLIDGKHIFGDVSIMMNLRQANSISDLIPHASTLDANLIQQVIEKHVSGVEILASPLSINEAQAIHPDNLFQVLRALEKIYQYIVIDGGNYLSDNTVTYMDTAQRILLVIPPNIASIRNAKQFFDIARSLSYPKEKILLLLNQHGIKGGIGISDIEKVLHTKIFANIPFDQDISNLCLNEGIPVILKRPNHPISKAIKKIAEIYSQQESETVIPINLMKEGNQKRSEILEKSSRLG